MTVQSDSQWEYTYVGDLKINDITRYGKVVKVEIGSMTNTIYFDNVVGQTIRTWHQFHSVEVKKES